MTLYPPQNLQPISYARNFCVNEFLKTDYEYLWFVDADTVPPINAFGHLTQPNADIISGITHTMKRDADGIIKRVAMTLRYDKEKDGYVEYLGKDIERIDRCGMSCCLVHRKVFEAINPPWFTVGNWDEETRGEDFRFCDIVREAGFTIFAHYDVVCEHAKTIYI